MLRWLLVGVFGSTYGHYELLELVETAPFYELFLARRSGESGFSKKVLLKRLAPMLESHGPSKEVFAEAAKLASSLLHSRIVHTHELGSVGSSLYVTMEYANGVDLAAVQRELASREKPLSPQIAVWIAHEVLDALDHAHRSSIVHGDLSAARVLIGAAGDVKVKDFGVAQALHHAKHGDTPLDARDDLLAVGIMLAELVTGWRLFVSQKDGPLLWQKLEQIQPALIETDLAFADHVFKALREDPNKRWQTAAKFRDALGEWLFDRRYRVSGQDVIAAVMTSLGGKERASTPTTRVTPRTISAQTPAQENQPRAGGTPVEGVPITPPLVAEVIPEAPRQSTKGKLHPSREPAPLARGTERAYEPIKPRKTPTPPQGTPRGSDSFTDAYNAALPPASPPTPPAIDPAGTFSPVASPVRILFRLATSRATGTFVVSSGAVRKQISIHDGHVDWITSNIAAERFDNYVAKHQLLSARELAGAAAMTSERADIIDTIMGLGLLGPRELRRHLADHIRLALVDVCVWRRGHYAWYPKQTSVPKVEGVRVDLFDALGAALAAVSDATIAEWEANHATLTPSPTPRVDPDRFHVEGLGSLLMTVGKSASVDQLAGSNRDSRQRRLRMLYLLEACELVVPG